MLELIREVDDSLGSVIVTSGLVRKMCDLSLMFINSGEILLKNGSA